MIKEEIIKTIKEQGIKFIRLQFADIFGQNKNVVITASQMEKALGNRCMFDGSSIEGFMRIEESDMYLYPDINTFQRMHFSDGQSPAAARLICDVYKTDGTPFEGDSRYILKKVLKEASDMGYVVNVGPECEFFLFDRDENGNPTVKSKDRDGYFDMSPLGNGGNCRRDICLTLEKMGFEVEASHHECAPAQHEIDFKYTNALTAADNIMTFKNAVKTIANRHGFYATFMPKPKYGIAGSGMHINISLADKKTGANAFCGDEKKLSETAYSFIAGILDKSEEFTAVTNPLVNSYKRLVSGYEAPVYIAWSASNRSPLIRVPSARGASTRIELRSPDPSCNPYLAIAVVVAAGLYGIKNKLSPPAPIDRNIYDMSGGERLDAQIRNLPSSLEEALGSLEKSVFIRGVLGEHIFSKYIEAKRQEWNDYRIHISEWEIENYLGKF